MKMTLHYEWKGLYANVDCTTPSNLYPRTKKEKVDVSYDYEVVVKVRDIVAYLMPYSLTHKKEKTADEVNEIRIANFYMTKAIEFLQYSGAAELEDLESDEYFVEFMKERYEEDALESWEDYNESVEY